MSISRHIPRDIPPLEVPLCAPTQEMAMELQDAASEGGVRFVGDTESSFDVGGSGEFVNVGTIDPTARALAQCEKWVLKPYRGVLKSLGWISLQEEGRYRRLFHGLQFLVICLWVFALLLVSVTQILTCYRRDTGPVDFTVEVMADGENKTVIRCSNHLVSNHILLDILIYISYIFGIYLFSKGETEYLTNLSARVFIKCSEAHLSKYSKILTVTAGFYLVLAVLYVFVSFIVRVMTAEVNDLYSSDLIIVWSNSTAVTDMDYGNPSYILQGGAKTALVIISLLGFISFDVVYVAAVMNYAAQSEMNIKLIYAIASLVRQKRHKDIDEAIKDVVETETYLKVLNGKTATAVALILFNLGAGTINAINNLSAASAMSVLAAFVSGFNCVLWGLIFSFPFIQAARVSAACMALKATGPEIRARPLQYSDSPQLELDSFVALTNSINLRAEMFGVPIYPWTAYLGLVVFMFIILLFFQNDVIAFTSYF